MQLAWLAREALENSAPGGNRGHSRRGSLERDAGKDSNMRRLIAIFVIWLGCGIAWMILGSTLLVRSGESSSRLTDEVHALWGPPMRQLPPHGRLRADPSRIGLVLAEAPQAPAEISAASTDLDVKLELEQRKKGLVWFPTYAVTLRGTYSFENPDAEPRIADLELPLESAHALYDGFEITSRDGPVQSTVTDGVARWSTRFAPHERKTFEVHYRSRGTSSWQYDLTSGTGNVRDFRLSLATDFSEVNFLPGTLSPSSHESAGRGWHGTWDFKTLVSSAPIGLALPERLNPGPLASRITFFAPVSLLFFFFVIAILAEAQKKDLHAMHYLFLGCAFFAFHLLFAYLVDHLSIAPSFTLSALVSTLLTVTYARLFVGWKFALREIGISQLLYLVLFSFTFFWSGFTGLAITVGAILTLFVLMQITGRRPLAPREEPPREPGCKGPYRCAAAAEPSAAE